MTTAHSGLREAGGGGGQEVRELRRGLRGSDKFSVSWGGGMGNTGSLGVAHRSPAGSWSGAGTPGREMSRSEAEGEARERERGFPGVILLTPSTVTSPPKQRLCASLLPGAHSALGWGRRAPHGLLRYRFRERDRRHLSDRTCLSTPGMRLRPSRPAGRGRALPKRPSSDTVPACPRPWAGPGTGKNGEVCLRTCRSPVGTRAGALLGGESFGD